MTSTRRQGGSIRPAAALSYATVSFLALVVCGLGVTSLLLDEDVISAPGLGQLPGILAVAAAVVGFAGAEWAGLRRVPASYLTALVAGLLAYLFYLGGAWVGVAGVSSDIALAGGVTGRLAIGPFGAVVGIAGFVCGWAGVALVRTRASRPRWPWEHDEDE